MKYLGSQRTHTNLYDFYHRLRPSRTVYCRQFRRLPFTRSEKEQDLPRLPTILASGPAFQPCLNICDLLAMMNISSISRGAIRSSRRLLWTVLVFIRLKIIKTRRGNQ